MHTADMPLLDVIRMRIRKPKESFGKMTHDSMLMQKLLVIEALREHLLFRRSANDGALIGKNELFRFDEGTRFFEKSRLSHLRQIEKKHACVDIIRRNEILAVMVTRRRVFHAAYVDIIQQMDIAVEHDIDIQIQNLIGELRYLIRKKDE